MSWKEEIRSVPKKKFEGFNQAWSAFGKLKSGLEPTDVDRKPSTKDTGKDSS